MTLKELKIKTFSLIEEYYPDLKGLAEDEDVLNKINGVVNQIQLDLMKYRKILENTEIDVAKDDDKIIMLKNYISNLYQIKTIKFDKSIDYEIIDGNIITLPNDYEGTFNIYYYKYPSLVKTVFAGENNEEIQSKKDYEDNSFEFELDSDLLEIMPYGIASDLLKMDMISGYGKYFYERYLEMKNAIDTRRTSGMISIVGGVDI